MKLGKSIPALILLLSLLASVAAWAKGDGHGGGRHGGKFGGGHFGGRQFEGARHFGGGGHVRVHPSFEFTIGPIWPFYYDPYYPNYYYPPPVVSVPVLPPGYWYYCFDPPGYYPYVQQCFGGWQQVVPEQP